MHFRDSPGFSKRVMVSVEYLVPQIRCNIYKRYFWSRVYRYSGKRTDPDEGRPMNENLCHKQCACLQIEIYMFLISRMNDSN